MVPAAAAIVVVVVVVEEEEEGERTGEGRHRRWKGSISGRGCYGANNRRLKRKNKGLAVHHRDFRPGQGFAEGTRGKKKGRSDEEAEVTGKRGFDPLPPPPTHTHTHTLPSIGRLSEASGSLPDHYLPYLPCDDDDGPSCKHH